MATIVTRSGKGSPLTNTEVDSNFTNLNTDKLETSGGTLTGNLSFGDNNKAIFGAGSDLQIYHDGAQSIIDDAGTGELKIRSNILRTMKYTGETTALFTADGAVTLYYDNAAKLATTSTGIQVTGEVRAENDRFIGGRETASAPTFAFHDDTDTGMFNIASNNLGFATAGLERMRIDSSGRVGIGTSSPSNGKLCIQGSGSYNSSGWGIPSDLTIRSSEMSDNAYHSILQLVSIRQSLTTGNASTGFLGFSTVDDSNNLGINDACRIAAVNEVGASAYSPVALSFWTNTGGSASNSPAERMRITSGGNVGIGTSSPLDTLHIHSGGIRIYDNTDGNGGVLAFGSAAGYQTISGGSGSNNMYYRTYANHIWKTATGASSTTDGTERMRIDSSGNLLVGGTATYPADNNVTGHSLTAVGQLQSSVSGYAPLIANRKTSDGSIAVFKKDGSTVGSIGCRSSGSNLQIYSASQYNSGIDFGGDGILPMSGSTITDNSKDIGAPTLRWKDLYLSGGVYLGGTGSANYLDDYEEGDWTPYLVASGYTFTNGAQTGLYTKVGNLVTCKCYYQVSYSSGSGSVTAGIYGLPFTSSSSYANYGGGSFYPDIGSSIFSRTGAIRTQANAAYIRIGDGFGGSNLVSNIDWSTMTNNMEFELTFQYFTN